MHVTRQKFGKQHAFRCGRSDPFPLCRPGRNRLTSRFEEDCRRERDTGIPACVNSGGFACGGTVRSGRGAFRKTPCVSFTGTGYGQPADCCFLSRKRSCVIVIIFFFLLFVILITGRFGKPRTGSDRFP